MLASAVTTQDHRATDGVCNGFGGCSHIYTACHPPGYDGFPLRGMPDYRLHLA